MPSSTKSNVVKAGIGYTVANVLVRGIGFLTLPLFSRLLDTQDFGIYNVFIAYDAILFCVISLGLHSSVKSANWEFPEKIDDYISSISLIYLINMALLIILSVVFEQQIRAVLGLEQVVIIALVLHSFGSSIVSLYNARVSLQYSYGKYMIVAIMSSLSNVALSLLLIVTIFNGRRYIGRIIGATVALLVVGLVLIAVFWYKSKPHANRSYWKFGVHYSLPIAAHGLSQVMLGQTGRLMTNYMVSTSAAGIYGLAANLSVIIAVMADSINNVWTTWFYETMEGENANDATNLKSVTSEELAKRGKVIRKRADQLAFLFAILTIMLMAISPEMIWVLGGDTYADGAFCAFGVILSGYCIVLYSLICVGEYFKKKTGYIMIGTMGAAALNIALNYWGIASFGYIAAAYASLAAYILYVSFHWVICKRLMGFPLLSLNRILAIGVVLTITMVVDFIAIYAPLARFGFSITIAALLLWVLIKSVGGKQGMRQLIGR